MKKRLIVTSLLALTLGFGVAAGLSLAKNKSNQPVKKAEAALPATTKTYRYTLPGGTGNQIYLHLWGSATASNNTSWSPSGFRKITEYYFNENSEKVFLFNTNVTDYSGMIIIKDNNNADGTKSADIAVGSNTAWYWNGNTGASPSAWTPVNATYYFYDYHNQFASGIYAYGYGSNHSYNNTWPGTKMTPVSGTSGQLYSVSLDGMFDHIIFNNNNDKQTNVDSDWCNQKHDQCMACWTNNSIASEWRSDLIDIYANDWVFQLMHFREIPTSDESDTGNCKGSNGYYKKAKDAYSAYSADIKTKISQYTEWNDAKDRLIAWGEANGETVSFSGTTLNINSRINVLPNSLGDDANSAAIIVIASILIVTALGGYFVLRKKKIK